MNIKKIIEECEISLKQIKRYDPDPFYVKYFLNQYIISINNIILGIFEEADRDFGLFILKEISEKTFYEKAKRKNDTNAIKFSEWFSEKYKEEHVNTYPNFMSRLCNFKDKLDRLPEIKIMIRAKTRYKDDINQQIIVKLNQGKLQSKEELEIEIQRQLPIFLEIINDKRKQRNEPKVNKNKVIASTFLNLESYDKDVDNIEIVYAAEIYIPVIKRLVGESRKKITELTKPN